MLGSLQLLHPSELTIPICLRPKGGRILHKVPKASMCRSHPWMTAPGWPQLMGGGRNLHQALSPAELGVCERSPAVANLSTFWDWKPLLTIKRKLSKWGYRIKVYKFWKQSMIFSQEFYLWIELNDTRKKEKYRTLFCPKVCNHTIHDYISYCNTKN